MNRRERNADGVPPVKIVLQRKPRPGAEEPLRKWVRTLVDTASRSPALEGSSVLVAQSGEYFILLRFDDGKPASDAVVNSCYRGHRAIQSRDLVFTRYSP